MYGLQIGVDADDLGIFSACWGLHGVGKTSLINSLAVKTLEQNPWRPVITASPISVLRPNTQFLIFSPGDLLAATLVLANWVYSEQAHEIARVQKAERELLRRTVGAVSWRKRKPVSSSLGMEADEWGRWVFGELQKDYRKLARELASVDGRLVADTKGKKKYRWEDRESLNELLMAFNQLVLTNQLGGSANIGNIAQLAQEFKETDKYSIADHVHGDFRYKHPWPAFRVICLWDEIGVLFGSDDNQQLKESAMYPWLTHARRLGCQVLASGHDASRSWVQLRQVFGSHYRTRSIASPWGRLWWLTEYKSVEDMEARENVIGHQIAWASWDEISRGTSYFNILSWSS